MQNFSSLASTQTDLDKFLTIFEENSRIFQENSKANSKKLQI
jgi:ribosomal protein S17E